ncbi:helix-turn-helix domain-containing protein [Kitasatospora sp. NPDC017646]|uniref:helix-turn-helix domain-containing protein n=1 Tax=Kitasatospora sp. NPDC017646 TaxID=3364024 RepID=UPI00379C9B22
MTGSSRTGASPTAPRRAAALGMPPAPAPVLGAVDWQPALSRAFARVEVSVRDAAAWTGSFATTRLGSLQISDQTSGPVAVLRDPASVTADPCRNIVAWLQLDGTARVFQDGRSVELPPHSLTFLDLSRPFKFVLPQPQRARTLMVPRSVIGLEEGALRRLTATLVSPADEGAGALLLPLLADACLDLPGASFPVREQAGRALADLLATLAADHVARTVSDGRSAAQPLFERITASVEDSLGDPDLSPQAIADRHGVSLRYLHQLFQRQGDTVGGWIRRRRLEAARLELARPGTTRRTISAVATHWGFISASHFSRAFRDAYGMSPNQWRAEQASTAAQCSPPAAGSPPRAALRLAPVADPPPRGPGAPHTPGPGVKGP